jgi:2-keto-4-pentenoate hydratase/2-oxohepta-3-ene-1,7-dioic acid hydratase in catechol pathway
MKLVTYSNVGQLYSQVGVWGGETIIPAATLLAQLNEDPGWSADMVRFLQLPRELLKKIDQAASTTEAKREGLSMDIVQLRAPVLRPGKVIGLGYNYRALCQNENVRTDREPELFAKLPTSVTGPFDTIVVPRCISKVDFEAELGVIIGRRCKDVSTQTALSYVAGYTVVNDITAKIIPRPPESGSVILALKGVDSFCPIGPCLVTSDEIPDPQALQILCRVNGNEKQNFNTSDMLHSVATVIAYITERITLEPGDLITTGTSLGIGIIQKPPMFLKNNDIVECEIRGIGAMRNRFNLLALS